MCETNLDRVTIETYLLVKRTYWWSVECLFTKIFCAKFNIFLKIDIQKIDKPFWKQWIELKSLIKVFSYKHWHRTITICIERHIRIGIKAWNVIHGLIFEISKCKFLCVQSWLSFESYHVKFWFCCMLFLILCIKLEYGLTSFFDKCMCNSTFRKYWYIKHV